MNPILAQLIGYVAVFLISIFFFNFLSNNFLFLFIRAKGSRGKLTLIEIEGIDNITYKLGKITGNELKFKGTNKKKKTILVGKEHVYRKLGVSAITLDEEFNAVRKTDYSVSEKFDAEAYDNLLVRGFTSPQITNNTDRIIILVLLAGILLISIYIAYNLTQLKPLILAIKQSGVVN